MKINNVNINQNERVDDLHRDGFKLIQSPDKFCFGVDAVLLTDFTKVKKGDTVLDIGTDTAVIPILLVGKTNGAKFYGIEVQEESAEMAERNVRLNNLESKIEIINDNVLNLENHIAKSSLDVVVTNPPYIERGRGIINETSKKAIARHEVLCTLEEIIQVTSKFIKTNGRFYMIHKPHRMVEIFEHMKKYNIEPKTVRLVYPKVDREPTMVLVEGIKNGRPMLKVLPPLIMYTDAGEYTQEIHEIYNREN